MLIHCRHQSPGQFVVFSLMLLVVPATSAESPRSALNRIIEHQMTAPDRSFAEQVVVCERIAAERAGPVLERARIASFNVTRRQVVAALGYLQARNQRLCERAVRHEGALRRDVLRYLYPTHDRFLDEGHRYHRLARRYRALPLGLRRYLEQQVGTEPFSLRRVLQTAGY